MRAGLPRTTRFIQILGMLSARMDADDRKLLDELLDIVSPPPTGDTREHFRRELASLVGGMLPRLDMPIIISELLTGAAMMAKLAGVHCYGFFQAAAIVWGNGTMGGTGAVWQTFDEQRRQVEQAHAERAKTGVAN